ncbi:MAG: DUF3168 domain-containing protein [Paenisporosarcina sp.]|nr:DUF3168 domain-containing protein [Paenisporosarcina sp.]
MIQTAMFELQRALYERLSSDQNLLAMVTGVFDAVDEDQPFPYVTIGEPSMLPFTTKQKFGEELAIVIHVWSVYDGKKESIDILNLCLASLAVRLSLDGFIVRKVEVDEIRVFDDTDPRIKHGVLRMKYTIQNN